MMRVFRLRSVLACSALLLLPRPDATAASDTRRCRCAVLSLGQYVAQAEIVLVGRVRSVRRVGPSATRGSRLEVVVRPLERAGPLKGSLDGVTLATATNSAACGVDVVPGRDYLIFASRDPAEPRLGWFDTCSGSRPLTGGAARAVADSVRTALAGPAAPSFHTSPACWSGPRIYHQGTPPAELRDRIRLSRDSAPIADSGGVVSPNGAYRAWLPPPSPETTGGASAYLLVDDETRNPLRIQLSGAISPPAVHWVNEKLLFMRIVWGRVQFTDLLVDVELARPIYEEAARYGSDAWAQYQTACRGPCAGPRP